MAKTLLAVNTLTSVNSQAYASHLNAAFRMGKDCPEDEFMLFNGYRVSIDRFRNQAAKIALQHECDYLWFVDDDVLIPPNTYSLLKARNVDIITPVTYIRSYPFKPMFFKAIYAVDTGAVGLMHYEDFLDVECENELLEAAAIGFSCCLIRVDILKKVPPAWFVTGTGHTEDVYFCVKARQVLDNKLGIYVDRSFAVGHQLDPEFVHPKTVDALRRFYEDLNPALKPTNGDNRADYLARQKAALDQIGYQLIELKKQGVEIVSET